jgi:hypothetical protein
MGTMERSTPPYQRPLARIAVWAAIIWVGSTYVGDDVGAVFSGLLLALILLIIGFDR